MWQEAQRQLVESQSIVKRVCQAFEDATDRTTSAFAELQSAHDQAGTQRDENEQALITEVQKLRDSSAQAATQLVDLSAAVAAENDMATVLEPMLNDCTKLFDKMSALVTGLKGETDTLEPLRSCSIQFTVSFGILRIGAPLICVVARAIWHALSQFRIAPCFTTCKCLFLTPHPSAAYHAHRCAISAQLPSQRAERIKHIGVQPAGMRVDLFFVDTCAHTCLVLGTHSSVIALVVRARHVLCFRTA